MSGICGIVSFDRRPVEPKLLKKMAEAAAHRGPDGITYWISDNVGLAHLALHTTPESAHERQPLVNRRGDVALTADARVDNRDELIRTLTAREFLKEREPTDAQLVLAAYECWQEECPEHLIGDFAFAIWDSSKRCVLLTRDPVGVRALFYCRHGQTLYFGTTISSILAALDECPPINDQLAIDFLCWHFGRWRKETIYEAIYRIPAAHSLSVRQDHSNLSRYWAPEMHPTLVYKRDEGYVEHFRSLFEEAVRCRLRSTDPIGISVSGGLDSSSIACMAEHICHNSSAEHAIRLYSCVFSRSERADEREYLKPVLDRCKHFSATSIDGDQIWGLKAAGSDTILLGDEPEVFPIACMLTEPLMAAHSHGCRVMMTGEGGDQLLNASAYWMPQLILDIPHADAWGELRHFWSRSGWLVPVKLCKAVIRLSLAGLIPIWPHRYRVLGSRRRAAPTWVREVRTRPANVGGSEADFGRFAGLPSQAAGVICQQLSSGSYAALHGYLSSVSAALGMEYCFPYLDRRLIEFVLVVPQHLRFSKGCTKVMLRRALTGILVDEVRQRTAITHFSEVLDYGLREKERAHVWSLVRSLAASQNRYIKARELISAWETYYESSALPTLPLIASILFQRWLQQHSNQ